MKLVLALAFGVLVSVLVQTACAGLGAPELLCFAVGGVCSFLVTFSLLVWSDNA